MLPSRRSVNRSGRAAAQVSRRTRWWAADPPVVAVFQPRAVVRADWRDRPDRCPTLATSRFLHISLGDPGKGPLFPILAIPATAVALVAWAVATARLSDGVRRASLVATIVAAGLPGCCCASAASAVTAGWSFTGDGPRVRNTGCSARSHTGDAGTRADEARRARPRQNRHRRRRIGRGRVSSSDCCDTRSPEPPWSESSGMSC